MTPTKYSFYQQIAKYRKASLLTSQYRAIVHLENKNDQTFWGKLLEIACPGSLFQFIPYTRSLSGNRGKGCAQCLVFKDFLDKNFVIAIDSDLHYLLKDLHDMDIEHFILQTYTYSFENHFVIFGLFGRLNITLFFVYIVSWKINLYICHNILKNNDGRY